MELFPAVVGQIGSWRYYATRMRPRSLCKQVSFAADLWPDSQMDDAVQRALNVGRAKSGIAKYLSRSPDRFFNSIVIAAMGGRPTFRALQLADDPQMQFFAGSDIDGAIGVLQFSEGVKYYALDGQHRLRAIGALINNETEFAMPQGFENEELPVIIVVQRDGEDRSEFVRKYRRLFGNLNRWAKPVDQATNIVLDEDDAFAIATRRLLQEHDFFRRIEGDSFARIRCEGTKSMNDNEPFFMTIIGLYEFNEELLLSPRRASKETRDELTKFRPEEEQLDEFCRQLSDIWTELLTAMPELRTEATRMRSRSIDVTVRDGNPCVPHLWFRPIGQGLMASVLREVINWRSENPELPTRDELKHAVQIVAALPRLLSEAPYRHLLFVPELAGGAPDSWKMRSENRKPATQAALEVLRFIAGLQPYDAEQLAGLKLSWSSLLLDASEAQVDQMWGEILEWQRKVSVAL